VMKEYINTTSTARLIVLGDAVIDSIEYRANQDDFRSNEGHKPNVFRATFGNDVNDLAVRAVHALGLEFGGVDILLSDTQPLVAEVNFPCFFRRCQMLTGTDISGMMVDYLVEKSKTLR
jgi:ribosomal protein S6--L-glutamate ligase